MKRILLKIISGVLCFVIVTPCFSSTYTSFYKYKVLLDKVNPKLTRLYFNMSTAPASRNPEEYLINKAAEYAYQNKKPYFVLYKSLSDAARNNSSIDVRLGNSFRAVNIAPIACAYLLLLNEHQENAFNTKKIIGKLRKEEEQELEDEIREKEKNKDAHLYDNSFETRKKLNNLRNKMIHESEESL